jgi:hypothetical protein
MVEQVFVAPLSDTKHTAVLYTSTPAPSWLTSTTINTTPLPTPPACHEHGGVNCQQAMIQASAASGWEVYCQIELKGSEEKAQVHPVTC